MTQKHLWQLVLIVFVLVWSVFMITPPTGRNLITEFQTKARNKDAVFSNIVAKAEQLQKENPARTYGNLKDAIGTNEISKYFPSINVKAEKDPSSYVLNRLQRDAAGKIKLGLDLQGGTLFLMGMDTTKLSTNVDRGAALSHAVEVLRKRVDTLGVAEPILQDAGGNRIMIQMPGLSEADKERARTLLQKPAYLEFRMVHPDSDQLLRDGIVEPGYEILKMEVKQRGNGRETKELLQYLVKKGAERGLTGKYLKRAYVTREQFTNKPEVAFEFNSEGAKLFGDLTTEWQPKGNKRYFLAIVLDGQLMSAPFIKVPILGGHGVIEGNYEYKEAADLVSVLENPLEAPVTVIYERSVEPSLGRDTVQSGIKAALIGTAAVAGFMLIYYLLAGLVADIALMLNIVILFGVLCSIEATLTMPGIAGIVLTIGMAVDANVLIFERVREELAIGKSMRGALAAGYNKAFSTIFDSNLTTLISSVILIIMGTGPVKGFGVTLTIGVTVSMFTALVVTRLIFDFLLAKNLLRNLTMLHIVRGAKIDFMRWAVPAFIASWILILIGNGYGILVRGRDLLGVEFSGGNTTTYSFAQKVETEKLRSALQKLQMGEPLIQYQKDISTGKETLNVTVRVLNEKAGEDVGKKVRDLLVKDFPQAGFNLLGEDQVGPTVGKEIRETAIVASLVAMFGILVYVAFRYEFSFAVGAVIAIIHDLLMTAGWYFLTGGQMSAPWVAAMLTIIGFSINDTIVIFDRIREDLKLGVRGTFREVMNKALNQTLSRTIITSGTVFLATLSLYIFGGGVIHDFALAFLVGIITGTYSSIYIASAIVLWWHKGERPKTASQVVMDTAASAKA
jgi:SecD/SecF fusion protein